MHRPVAPDLLHPSSAKQVSPPCQTGSSSAKQASLAKQARLAPRQVPSAIRVDPNRDKDKDKDKDEDKDTEKEKEKEKEMKKKKKK